MDQGTKGTRAMEDMAAIDLHSMKRRDFFIPLWQANLIFFAILFMLNVSYFFYQIRNSQELYIKDAKEHARLVAGVLKLHVKGALLSRKIILDSMTRFLGNTARFVAYLDAIEPFTETELEGFAEESGLVGLCLVRDDGTKIEGPRGWMPGDMMPRDIPKGGLKHYEPGHMVLFRADQKGPAQEVIIGVDAFALEELRSKIGLKTVLAEAEKLNGIRYIKMDASPGPNILGQEGPPFSTIPDAEVVFMDSDQGLTAEVAIPFGKGHLTVGLDAAPLQENRQRLWRDFELFTFFLALVGGILSYLLYRQQLIHMEEARKYERRLAQQREEVLLGRSAAAIAHEIRNPLNAMAIALQRLRMEAKELHGEHQRLLTILIDSVKRTNKIIECLLNFARVPSEITRTNTDLSRLVEEVLDLYASRFIKSGVVVQAKVEPRVKVKGDKDLLVQMFENVLINALEAQPHGGRIAVELHLQKDWAVLTVTNPGDIPKGSDIGKIFSPYFTLKTRGTGLGLAIIEKIAKAHRGKVKASVKDETEFQLEIRLPTG